MLRKRLIKIGIGLILITGVYIWVGVIVATICFFTNSLAPEFYFQDYLNMIASGSVAIYAGLKLDKYVNTTTGV